VLLGEIITSFELNGQHEMSLLKIGGFRDQNKVDGFRTYDILCLLLFLLVRYAES
jgi:hypothetical protein